MTTQQDASVGFKKESVFGTAVVVDKFVEFTAEEFNWSPTFANGGGMRVGRVVNAADRRVLVKEETTGAVELELVTKGMGALFEGALGTATSTIIAGAAYQQVITPTTADFLPSYTFQVGLPYIGNTVASPQTYNGVVCSGFELTASNGGIPSVKFNYMGKAMETSTALATPAYPATNELYSFIHGAVKVGAAAVVAPTSTALGTGGTSVANVREFSLTWDNGLDSNGFNFGSVGQRTRKSALGLRSGSGSLTVEYDSNTLRDAWKSQTDLSLVLTFQSTVLISGSSYPTFQITIPNIRLNGDMPKPSAGDVATLAIPFDVLDNRVAASALYIAIVTAETAI